MVAGLVISALLALGVGADSRGGEPSEELFFEAYPGQVLQVRLSSPSWVYERFCRRFLSDSAVRFASPRMTLEILLPRDLITKSVTPWSIGRGAFCRLYRTHEKGELEGGFFAVLLEGQYPIMPPAADTRILTMYGIDFPLP